MPTHTPHFPDLLHEQSALLRRWEDRLVGHLQGAGYRELHPSLILREPLEDAFVQFFDGAERVALRSDFTVSLGRMLAQRFPDPPAQVCYAGAVFRRPTQPWEPVERFEVGCERLHLEPSPEADLELGRLLLAVPSLVGLQGGLLQVGHGALVRRPLEAEGVDASATDRLLRALSRRAPHRIPEALEGHPAAPRLVRHFQALLEAFGGEELALDSPYADLLREDLAHLSATAAELRKHLPDGFALRLDPADVGGFPFYTGPTLRLWAPGAQSELASGGRYDGLYPSLGRPWRAAGFCVRLSRLLDLAQTRPEIFSC